MAIFLTFILLLVASCSFAILYGGAVGQRGAAIFILATAASSLSTWSPFAWSRTNWALGATDFACLVALSVLASWSRRYWPIWAAGFQLISTATHLAMSIAPAATPKIYQALETFWAMPTLLLMIAGIVLDRAAGLSDPLPWRRAVP